MIFFHITVLTLLEKKNEEKGQIFLMMQNELLPNKLKRNTLHKKKR